MGSRSPKTPLVEGPGKPGIPPTKEAAALQCATDFVMLREARSSRFPHHCGRSTSWDLGGSRLSDSGLAKSGGILCVALLFRGLGKGPKFCCWKPEK